MNPLDTAIFLSNIGDKTGSNAVLDIMFRHCKTIEQLDAIGELYAKNRYFTKAAETAEKMLLLTSDTEAMFDIRTNIARSYLNAVEPEKAFPYIQINRSLRPSSDEYQLDIAYYYFLQNEKKISEELINEVEERTEDSDILDRCKFNLASHKIRNGNFKEGINDFLTVGRKLGIWRTINKIPHWKGEDLPQGTKIAVHAEGGIGDEIINIRFMHHLESKGLIPYWVTDRTDLAIVFERCGFRTATLEESKTWQWTYSMLVPVYLGIEESDLWNGPYLCAKSPSKKNTTDKLRIGIKVSGNPEYDQDLARTIPLNKVIESLPENAEIVSFHKDEVLDHPRIINWMDSKTTWDDTLNELASLDYLITSCTSIAHAAGAMGVKTFVLTPILKYYIWANEKDKSPWYGDNTTVLHQHKFGDWSESINELTRLLK